MKPEKSVANFDNQTITHYALPDGRHHREDGPAWIVEYDDGAYAEEWLYNGKKHRYGGPAVTNEDNEKWYFVHGNPVNIKVAIWLSDRDYKWETMTDIEKWELEIFMRSLG